METMNYINVGGEIFIPLKLAVLLQGLHEEELANAEACARLLRKELRAAHAYAGSCWSGHGYDTGGEEARV